MTEHHDIYGGNADGQRSLRRAIGFAMLYGANPKRIVATGDQASLERRVRWWQRPTKWCSYCDRRIRWGWPWMKRSHGICVRCSARLHEEMDGMK